MVGRCAGRRDLKAGRAESVRCPRGRSRWPGERRRGERGGQSRVVCAPEVHVGRETGAGVPGTGEGEGTPP